MEDNLFLLIRLGLGLEDPSEEAVSHISKMKGKQWLKLRKMANKQGVLAIALDGFISLYSKYGQRVIRSTINRAKWEDFLYDWMGNMLMMEQINKEQVDVMNDMAKRWSDAGCRVMIMKGQANGLFYPHPNHRSKGDIDCYLFEDYTKGNDIAREAGATVDESWYKHSVIKYRGESFENHQFFVTTRDGKRSKLLEQELEEELAAHDSWFKIKESKLTHFTNVPPVQWTAMFLTYHACSHFISEGMRLKQLLDWAMFLQSHQQDVNWPRFYEFCDRHHLDRFADVATAIAKEYLGILITDGDIRVESPYTERVLHSVLYDNDFVFGSGRSKWYNRWHLIKNLWTYRWKYRDIYQMSPLRQFWYYATGFIFKTE